MASIGHTELTLEKDCTPSSRLTGSIIEGHAECHILSNRCQNVFYAYFVLSTFYFRLWSVQFKRLQRMRPCQSRVNEVAACVLCFQNITWISTHTEVFSNFHVAWLILSELCNINNLHFFSWNGSPRITNHCTVQASRFHIINVRTMSTVFVARISETIL